MFSVFRVPTCGTDVLSRGSWSHSFNDGCCELCHCCKVKKINTLCISAFISAAMMSRLQADHGFLQMKGNVCCHILMSLCEMRHYADDEMLFPEVAMLISTLTKLRENRTKLTKKPRAGAVTSHLAPGGLAVPPLDFTICADQDLLV